GTRRKRSWKTAGPRRAEPTIKFLFFSSLFCASLCDLYAFVVKNPSSPNHDAIARRGDRDIVEADLPQRFRQGLGLFAFTVNEPHRANLARQRGQVSEEVVAIR